MDFSATPPSINGGDDDHQQMLCFSSTSPYHRHTSSVFLGNLQQGALRGPFTPSQWMELEHQALIYKYINANVPVPSYLLNPIRKAFHSAGFSCFAGLRSNASGWGAFHLGFASTDPEPGRCRRTDGKKWRCARDAVTDQKYCERHMNRGRHRSRKPVEGQSGQPAAKTGGGKSTPAASSSASASTLSHPSGIPNTNKIFVDKDKASTNNHHHYNESSSFGSVCSDSLLNPLNRSSSLINNQGSKSHHHPLRQFMDEWPENHTHLSISISSPPRFSRELDMGLGVGPAAKRTNHWVPISWEPSMGGPLGEALHTSGECKKTKPLNFMGTTWDGNSPRLASSPTGVLQRGQFGSLSSSSSPRAGLVNPSLPSL